MCQSYLKEVVDVRHIMKPKAVDLSTPKGKFNSRPAIKISKSCLTTKPIMAGLTLSKSEAARKRLGIWRRKLSSQNSLEIFRITTRRYVST